MPLINLEAIPERLQGDPSMSGHGSDRATPPMTPVADRATADQAFAGLAANAKQALSAESNDDLPFADRKQTHVLVVEDK